MFYVGIKKPGGSAKLGLLASFTLETNIIRPFLINWDSFDHDALELKNISGKQAESTTEGWGGERGSDRWSSTEDLTGSALWCRQLWKGGLFWHMWLLLKPLLIQPPWHAEQSLGNNDLVWTYKPSQEDGLTNPSFEDTMLFGYLLDFSLFRFNSTQAPIFECLSFSILRLLRYKHTNRET